MVIIYSVDACLTLICKHKRVTSKVVSVLLQVRAHLKGWLDLFSIFRFDTDRSHPKNYSDVCTEKTSFVLIVII